MLKKHIYWYAAARIPVATKTQPFRLKLLYQSTGNTYRTIFVESTVIAKRGEVKLERLALYQLASGHIINNQMRKIRLPGHRT